MQGVSEPTEIDRDVCGRAIIAAEADKYGDVLTSDTKIRLFTSHNNRRMRGEGLLFSDTEGEDPTPTLLGFTFFDCGRIDAYMHENGHTWTQDADGWVCDCTGVEIEVRA